MELEQKIVEIMDNRNWCLIKSDKLNPVGSIVLTVPEMCTYQIKVNYKTIYFQ